MFWYHDKDLGWDNYISKKLSFFIFDWMTIDPQLYLCFNIQKK